MTGLLIVGHGTRQERGLLEFFETVEAVSRRLSHTPVEAGFLELAQPTIAEGLLRLHDAGCQRIVVLPLLLFAAGHAKEDIPAAVQGFAQQHPELSISFASHLGLDERLLRLSALRYEEAAQRTQASAQDTLWLMVGRGSRDETALAELQEFVQRRLRFTPVGQTRIAFLAMAQPALTEMLPRIAELRFRRVIVQPHLLFEGELLETVRQEVDRVSTIWPAQEWRLTGHLGSADLLVEAVAERYWEQLRHSRANRRTSKCVSF